MIDKELVRDFVKWLKDVMKHIKGSEVLDESLQILTEEAEKEHPDLKRASKACRAILKSEDELDMLYHFASLDSVTPALKAVKTYHLMRGVFDTLACVGGGRFNKEFEGLPVQIIDLIAAISGTATFE